jgi:hypothetical protein
MPVPDRSDYVVDSVVPLAGAVGANPPKPVDSTISVSPVGADAGDLIARQITVLSSRIYRNRLDPSLYESRILPHYS